MSDRYKDRLKILEDREIEELYGRPQFNHEERVHFFSLTPEERAVADGHYNLASRVLFILQAGYSKPATSRRRRCSSPSSSTMCQKTCGISCSNTIRSFTM
ncbi:MAG TPA: hypothetical protein DCS21_04805 [Gammaproteobacteria bacterium]|nr:hypothetical protein [Gammaproteobacteria bacterium]